jgi:hypothetical protein
MIHMEAYVMVSREEVIFKLSKLTISTLRAALIYFNIVTCMCFDHHVSQD